MSVCVCGEGADARAAGFFPRVWAASSERVTFPLGQNANCTVFSRAAPRGFCNAFTGARARPRDGDACASSAPRFGGGFTVRVWLRGRGGRPDAVSRALQLCAPGTQLKVALPRGRGSRADWRFVFLFQCCAASRRGRGHSDPDAAWLGGRRADAPSLPTPWRLRP